MDDGLGELWHYYEEIDDWQGTWVRLKFPDGSYYPNWNAFYVKRQVDGSFLYVTANLTMTLNGTNIHIDRNSDSDNNNGYYDGTVDNFTLNGTNYMRMTLTGYHGSVSSTTTTLFALRLA